MAVQIEEKVVPERNGSSLLRTRLPYFKDGRVRPRCAARRCVRRSSANGVRGSGNFLTIDFSRDRHGNSRQLVQKGRHHIGRQALDHALAQCGAIDSVAGAKNDIGRDLLGRAMDGCRGGDHLGSLRQRRFDFRELHAEPAHFNLIVQSPKVLQISFQSKPA